MKYEIISIIGLSKNAGKTTLLNYLIKQYEQQEQKLGIASIGVDGEKVDLLTGQPKPLIHVPKGALVVTTEEGLTEGTATWRIYDRIGSNTSIDNIYIAEAIEEGTVKLIGTHTINIITNILQYFKLYGAEKVIIDGAYDRFSSANPSITNQVYLVIGASLHQDQEQFWNIVDERLSRFFYPVTNDQEIIELVKEWKEEETLLIKHNNGWSSYSANHLIVSKKLDLSNIEKLVIPGALLEKSFSQILQQKKGFDIVIKNGLKSFVPANMVKRWIEKGGSLKVLDQINLKGIAYNPYSPLGYSFSDQQMKRGIKEILDDYNHQNISVFNVWSQENEI